MPLQLFTHELCRFRSPAYSVARQYCCKTTHLRKCSVRLSCHRLDVLGVDGSIGLVAGLPGLWRVAGLRGSRNSIHGGSPDTAATVWRQHCASSSSTSARWTEPNAAGGGDWQHMLLSGVDMRWMMQSRETAASASSLKALESAILSCRLGRGRGQCRNASA